MFLGQREEPREFRQLEEAASSSVWFGVCSAFLTQLAKEGNTEILLVSGVYVLENLDIPRMGLQFADEVPCLIQVISEAVGFVGFTAECIKLQWEFE